MTTLSLASPLFERCRATFSRHLKLFIRNDRRPSGAVHFAGFFEYEAAAGVIPAAVQVPNESWAVPAWAGGP